MSENLTPRAAEIRLAQYGERGKPYECGNEKALYEIALALKAELTQWHATYGRDALPGALARLERAETERDQYRAAAESAEAKLRKIEHGCETPESHNYGCACAAASTRTAGDEQPETERLRAELDRVRGERDELHSQADFWRESYRLVKGYTDDELNARLAIDEATRPHRPPCRFPSSPDCTCTKGGAS